MTDQNETPNPESNEELNNENNAESTSENTEGEQQAESSNEVSNDLVAGFSIETVIEDAKKVILDPVGFFKNMPQTGGFGEPLIFAIVMTLAAGVIGAVLSMIGLAKFNAVSAGVAGFSLIIFLPIMAIIGSFVGGAILFVIWKLMGSQRSYETAFRCVAYSSAIAPVISVLSILPYIAGIVKTLWSMFLFYLASIHVHNIKDQTAKIVFGILAVILTLGGISSERTARKLADHAERWKERAEQTLGKEENGEYKPGSIGDALQKLENADVENMTPEEAGKQAAEFLKGFEKFAESLEENLEDQKEAEESN